MSEGPVISRDYFEKFDQLFAEELQLALRERGRGGLAGLADSCAGTGKSQDFARVIAELPVDVEHWDSRGAPSDLVGLALSGGGIRSATFSLGVLQALGWLKIFQCVDYLSTVSGGGFLGACISSVYSGLAKGEPFPFAHERGKPEHALFRHLRNSANYLAPEGALDFFRLPALLVRGILLHAVSLAPFLLTAALATSALQTRLRVPYFTITTVTIAVTAILMILFSIFHLFAQRTKASTWAMRDQWSKALGALMIAIGIAVFVDVQPVAIDLSIGLLRGRSLIAGDMGAFGISIASVIPFFAAVAACFRYLLRAQRVAMYLLAALGFFSVWAFYLAVCATLLVYPQTILVVAGIAAVMFVYALTTIDLNYTSLHRFYRDRLSKAYLVRTGPDGGVTGGDGIDRLRLSELTGCGPYHLINAAINIDQPDEAYKKGRRANAFLFSRAFIGSEITGYLRSEAMEQISRQVDLGTAMAISGAAVAPASGKTTNRPLRFLMAILNVRLNYWLPNPAHVHERGRRLLHRSGVWTLFAEMFGGLKADQANVNLTDGGHFENLGIYELVRRRCRLIIVSDAECDPKYEFAGLADAIRMVLIDFGTQIEIDGLDAIRRGDRHYAIGTIRYGEGQEGRLIYLKASLRGDSTLSAALPSAAYLTSPYRADNRGFDLNPYIARYRAAHPDFPQETTADQFFDEEQFECYRALGYEVATAALRA